MTKGVSFRFTNISYPEFYSTIYFLCLEKQMGILPVLHHTFLVARVMCNLYVLHDIYTVKMEAIEYGLSH